jgi:dTDP-4-dehydrorhamnose reductase
MHLVIIGSTGQLGSDLQRVLRESFFVTPLSHSELDICDRQASYRILAEIQPDLVIDCAAYHQTDACEESADKAFAVNAIAAKTLAEICDEIGTALAYISTDYVFDGRKGSPYQESDPPRPINAYGISKLAGEHFVMSILKRYYIFRLASLYGTAGSRGKGGNFVETMIERARAGKPLRVVSDIHMSPTCSQDAAQKIREVIQARAPYGIYHIVNAGHCSWYEFAQAIFEDVGLRPELIPIRAADYPAKAKRPAFSALECRRLTEVGLSPLRNWREALSAYLREKGHLRR